jgi:hypothetical protein
MAKSSTSRGAKKSRVKVKDLKAKETKLTAKQMKKVRGGDAGGANQETGTSTKSSGGSTSAVQSAVSDATKQQSTTHDIMKAVIQNIK